MAKTVAEVLRLLKPHFENSQPQYLDCYFASDHNADAAMSAMRFWLSAQQTNSERFDRAIALAEAADKDRG